VKTVVVSIQNPVEGDLIVVEYNDVRGGSTSVKHRVIGARKRPILDDNGFAVGFDDIPAETARDIALLFAMEINTEWMKEAFTAKVKEGSDRLIVGCTDLVSERIRFQASVAGNGGTTVEIEEL
jgi:hypothetical protein